MERALSFDVASDFAIFRRGYTTTSALTYAIPPKPTLLGLIGAILGRDYDDYNTLLNESKIAIRVLSPIRKVVVAQNLIDTSSKIMTPIIIRADKGRTRASFEYLRNPRFRIFFSSDDESYTRLRDMLQAHRTYFTPYLGQASCIADIGYRGEMSVRNSEVSAGNAPIDSVIPLDSFSMGGVVFEKNRKYGRDRLPAVMKSNRVVEKYVNILYEVSGNSITVNHGTYQAVSSPDGTENVIFF